MSDRVFSTNELQFLYGACSRAPVSGKAGMTVALSTLVKLEQLLKDAEKKQPPEPEET